MFNPEEKARQTEFFSDLPKGPKKSLKEKLRLGQIAMTLSYENLILLAIGLIMTLIVCYSLGVEKGKFLAQGPKELEDIIEKVQEVTREAEKKPAQKPVQPEKTKLRIEVAQNQLTSSENSPYIQVASFRSDKYANKEMERLKKHGYQPFALKWGKYRVVCVGGYYNQEQARQALTQLKKLYADCILRKK